MPAVVSEVLQSPGHALDTQTRATLEPHFGHDFSRVRVHTDAKAAESTRSIDALAYTVGPHIVFGNGQYAPSTSAGQRLLAHELIHVIQQAGSAASGALTLGEAGDPLEREADHIADQMKVAPAQGFAPAIARGAAPAVRRQEATPMGAAEQKEARLRRMAAYPGEALQAWKGLSQPDRDSILWKMIDRYGADFASDFLNYANGTKKPNISATITNSPDITPKWLKDHGYRLAGDPGGIQNWVHPSGHEYHVTPASTAKPPPESEPDDRQERCADPCMDSTDDEDACHKCCDDRIPKDDVRCRRTCHVSCDIRG